MLQKAFSRYVYTVYSSCQDKWLLILSVKVSEKIPGPESSAMCKFKKHAKWHWIPVCPLPYYCHNMISSAGKFWKSQNDI